MSPFREIAVLPPQSQNRQSADIARKQRSTARLQTDARPSRDGSERFGSGTQAYGQIRAGRVELRAQMISGSFWCPKRNAF